MADSTHMTLVSKMNLEQLIEQDFGKEVSDDLVMLITAYAVRHYGNNPGIVLIDGVWQFYDMGEA